MSSSSTTPAAARDHPVFRDLTPRECAVVLARGRVGRLAWSFHDRVDIQPLYYVYDGTWIYGRTSPGLKLVTLQHNPWVAFEVDEVRGTFDWTSIVVKGSFHRLEVDGTPQERLAREHALWLLRHLAPATLRDGDPVPWRDVLFRIAIDETSGREARPGV